MPPDTFTHLLTQPQALGAERIHHCRVECDKVLMRCLLSLDYVLGHTGLPWLPTEPEKVGAFETIGIERRLAGE